MPVRIAIHAGRGLTGVADYYRMFSREPSPAGDMQLEPRSIREMLEFAQPSFETALDHMLGADAGGVVLLVCHAEQGGLFLHLTGGNAAFVTPLTIKQFKDLEKAENFAEGVRHMPSKSDAEKNRKAAAWAFLNRGINSGQIPTGSVPTQPSSDAVFNLAEVEKDYNDWRVDVLTKSLILDSMATFQRLVRKMIRLRAMNLDRVELRACDIGSNRDTMIAIRDFFGCKKLLAPNVHTTYSLKDSGNVESLNDVLPNASPAERQNQVLTISRVPGPVNGNHGARTRRVARIDWGLLSRRIDDHHTRQFLLLEPRPLNGQMPDPSLRMGGYVIGGVVVVRDDAIPNTVFSEGDLAIFTDNDDGQLDEERVTRFIQACIMPGATWRRGRRIRQCFLQADGVSNGFDVIWPDRTHGQAALGPFIFPNEPEYVKHIIQV